MSAVVNEDALSGGDPDGPAQGASVTVALSEVIDRAQVREVLEEERRAWSKRDRKQ
jgi:hypothetical protein